MRNELLKRIAEGLKRQSISTCSRWAKAYRMMGKPYPGLWNFDHHPWLLDFHDSKAEVNVAQKCAQVGFTEACLNRTFYNLDVKKVSCLYVLPAKVPDAADFSASRFDPAIEMSVHIASMFSNTKNIGHKRAGTVSLFIRGSKSRSSLKSVPVEHITFDEVDEMMQENIPLAFERTSGQETKSIDLVSTPTIDNYGINKYYLDSTQEEFNFKCPHCNRTIVFKYPESIIITADELIDPKINESHYICYECKHKLEHKEKKEYLKNGFWVARNPQCDIRGFQINQMYSMGVITPIEFAKAVIRARSNKADEQELFNSKLGVTHVPEGSQLDDTIINKCLANYNQFSIVSSGNNRLRTMGVDVGKHLHCEVDEWVFDSTPGKDLNLTAKCKVLACIKAINFEQLYKFMQDYQIHCAVIDANPERRKAKEFSDSLPAGRVWLCYYGRGIQGKLIKEVSNSDGNQVTVDRTSWLDLAMSRFFNQTILLPKDISIEYKEHLKQLVRITIKDADGNPTGKYISRSDNDHYAHARNYAEIALPLAVSRATNQDIRSFL